MVGEGILKTGYVPLSSSWTIGAASLMLVLMVLAACIWSWKQGHFKNLNKVAVDILDDNR